MKKSDVEPQELKEILVVERYNSFVLGVVMGRLTRVNENNDSEIRLGNNDIEIASHELAMHPDIGGALKAIMKAYNLEWIFRDDTQEHCRRVEQCLINNGTERFG